MKQKFGLIFLNCLLTIIYQLIYHYRPAADSLRYLQLADYYSYFILLPSTNCFGHSFYAAFLLLVGNILSNHYFIVGLIQTVIFSLSAIFLIRELEIYYKRNLTGLLFLLFLVPEINIYNGYVLTESLSYSMILVVFGLGLKIVNHQVTSLSLWLLSLSIGFMILNRLETIVIYIPILFLIFPKIRDRLVRHVSIIVSFTIIFLLFNGLKNYRIYKDFKFSAYNGGEVIYGGNNLNLDGSHHEFTRYMNQLIPDHKIADFKKIVSLEECYSCPKRDSFYLKLAVEAWQANPYQQMKVIPQKIAKNWLLPGDFDIYTGDTTKTRGLQISNLLSSKYFGNNKMAPYKHLFYMLIHWVLLLFILIGMLKIRRNNRFQLSVLLTFFLFLLYSIPFCGLPRWHVEIFPLLIIAFFPAKSVRKINSYFY